MDLDLFEEVCREVRSKSDVFPADLVHVGVKGQEQHFLWLEYGGALWDQLYDPMIQFEVAWPPDGPREPTIPYFIGRCMEMRGNVIIQVVKAMNLSFLHRQGGGRRGSSEWTGMLLTP